MKKLKAKHAWQKEKSFYPDEEESETQVNSQRGSVQQENVDLAEKVDFENTSNSKLIASV